MHIGGSRWALPLAACAAWAAAAPHATAQVALDRADRPGHSAAAKGGVVIEAAAPAEAAAALPPATQALLEEINRRRAEGATCGSQHKPPAPPMRWSAVLLRAADAHVRDMARQSGGIGHTGSDGSSVGTRVEATGYRWRSVGENVAAGRPTASATLAQWMASPGHCANIMNPGFIDVAVAGLRLAGTRYEHYWVMVLARE